MFPFANLQIHSSADVCPSSQLAGHCNAAESSGNDRVCEAAASYLSNRTHASTGTTSTIPYAVISGFTHKPRMSRRRRYSSHWSNPSAIHKMMKLVSKYTRPIGIGGNTRRSARNGGSVIV